MPRKQIDPESTIGRVRKDLVEGLVTELKSDREAGQPLIYEHVFKTGKVRIIVIWDKWHDTPLQERSSTILRAYEVAEGPEARDRIALASGLTVPEAHAAGMLPYRIITALRKSDPLTFDQARQAMLEQGGSQLYDPMTVQLRFTTEQEAEAARQRLIQRFPGSDDVWIVEREIMAQDFATAQDWAQAEET